MVFSMHVCTYVCMYVLKHVKTLSESEVTPRSECECSHPLHGPLRYSVGVPGLVAKQLGLGLEQHLAVAVVVGE